MRMKVIDVFDKRAQDDDVDGFFVEVEVALRQAEKLPKGLRMTDRKVNGKIESGLMTRIEQAIADAIEDAVREHDAELVEALRAEVY